mmetsp:Transcript_38666/g.61275  ORF Transcript_38666/g.61275 Transcript_38666/m.61275 type:complete len:529 (-) Transcript_38666:63-1649(-)|eukprot:CAMPEP_0201531058 /NCGR_PEP_ID=MMETSP0161_2-20130828/46483_1 /ASSEMBLY_ACC=CAM_ASM_000251 /TAXON_ID=180227 /ORGANISM="Neoparamoeba aestuarina, Strain SoJaBio B1-5/56/2" /LENGTH=528 /DNA_ID=CAMNT_0047933721 /DNA_START=46 /DNA_END=1632 /DNA_ORIENTATION=-
MKCWVLLLVGFVALGASTDCNYQNLGGSSGVCACSVELGCDTVVPVGQLSNNDMAVYTTTKDGQRLARTTVSFVQSNAKRNAWDDVSDQVNNFFGEDSDEVVVMINSSTYQTMIGFGGALTDAAAIDIFAMKDAVQQQIINSYYADDGIQYTVGRLPMAGCDFSTYPYSYCDTDGDFNLTTFSVDVDLTTKLPLTWMAQNASSSKIQLFASPWSAPAWMKTNDNFVGGSLIGTAGDNYHQTWANYYSKYLDAYKGYGIDIWGVTAQNEPSQKVTWNSMFWTAETQRDWIKTDLGPVLEKNGHGGVKVMILDDQRYLVANWAKTVFSDPDANKYVSGTGVHWYGPKYYSALSEVHNEFPDKFILATEACEGYIPVPGNHVKLGDWSRAVSYMSDIIADIDNWAAGWTDWNIALDLTGGPNWASNFVDSPIICNTTSGDIFYKQPMFYAMAHWSKFVRPGSFRKGLNIVSGAVNKDIEALAFETTENQSVIVLQNTGKSDFTFNVQVEGRGTATAVAPAHSFQTYIYKTN